MLGTGPNDRVLSSAFGRRNDQDYHSELGETLIRLARVVPAGMLVFFPSYGTLLHARAHTHTRPSVCHA